MKIRFITAVMCVLLLIGDFNLFAQSSPNIILILVDDAGYADFSCYGSNEIKTPNIDHIARKGVKFTQAYVSSPVCSPSSAGLITGRYQQRFGHEFNIPRKPAPGEDLENLGLPLTEITLAKALQEQGYYTGLIGKWHLGDVRKLHPLNHGFNDFFGFLHGSRSYFPKQNSEKQDPILRNFDKAGPQSYLTEAFGNEALAFIERNKKHPFFLYLSFSAVHSPMEVNPEHEQMFSHIADIKRRKLAAMTYILDLEIGKLLKKLDDQELTENTAVFFINDNGGESIVNAASNGILNGIKGTLLGGGIRVPFIIQWPGKLPAGKTFDKPVSSLDIFVTALAIANAKPVTDRV